MSNIESIISGLIRRAGGYVKYAADSGGPAHFGISQHTLSIYLGRNASTAEIENLDQTLAHKIYRQN
jgi:lysozyme family protein